jgi:hypothetical protein
LIGAVAKRPSPVRERPTRNAGLRDMLENLQRFAPAQRCAPRGPATDRGAEAVRAGQSRNGWPQLLPEPRCSRQGQLPDANTSAVRKRMRARMTTRRKTHGETNAMVDMSHAFGSRPRALDRTQPQEAVDYCRNSGHRGRGLARPRSLPVRCRCSALRSEGAPQTCFAALRQFCRGLR